MILMGCMFIMNRKDLEDWGIDNVEEGTVLECTWVRNGWGACTNEGIDLRSRDQKSREEGRAQAESLIMWRWGNHRWLQFS